MFHEAIQKIKVAHFMDHSVVWTTSESFQSDIVPVVAFIYYTIINSVPCCKHSSVEQA